MSMLDVVLKDVPLSCTQMYVCAPSTMLPVMPHVRDALDSDSEPRRSAAVDLMVGLYCLPGSDVVRRGFGAVFVHRITIVESTVVHSPVIDPHPCACTESAVVYSSKIHISILVCRPSSTRVSSIRTSGGTGTHVPKYGPESLAIRWRS